MSERLVVGNGPPILNGGIAAGPTGAAVVIQIWARTAASLFVDNDVCIRLNLNVAIFLYWL